MLIHILLYVFVLGQVGVQRTQGPRDWTTIVDQNLDLYAMIPSRRDPNEGALVRSGTLYIKYRHDLTRLTAKKRDAFMCDATSWLLAGRLTKSKGLSALMGEYPQIKHVKLVIFSVNTSVTLNRKGRYDQRRKLRRQATISISRERLQLLDGKRAKKSLATERCMLVANSLVDEMWVDSQD